METLDLILLVVWNVLLFGGVLAVILWVTRLSPKAKTESRIEAIGGRVHIAGNASGDEAHVRRQLIQKKLKELETQRRTERRNRLSQLILQSGLPITIRDYIIGSVLCSLLAGLGLWMLGMPITAWLLGTVACGLTLPRLTVAFATWRLQKRFGTHFANALDVIVRGARSGLPVGECMKIVANEIPDPVGREFDLMTEGQRLGMTLKQALDRMLSRIPTTDVQFFAIALLIQQQTGGNLASTLENLSNILRSRKRLRDKIKALAAEANVSAMIIGSLPFLVCIALLIFSPRYMSLLFTERLGNFMLVAGLTWMALGVFIMRQMIRFNI